jgi:hypothetical protein
VEIVNASHRGPLQFEVPRVAIEASMRMRGGEPHRVPMPLDTLIVDADAHCVHLVFRVSFGVHRKLYDLEWSRIELVHDGGIPHTPRQGAAHGERSA